MIKQGWIPQTIIDTALSFAMFDYIRYVRCYAKVLHEEGKFWKPLSRSTSSVFIIIFSLYLAFFFLVLLLVIGFCATRPSKTHSKATKLNLRVFFFLFLIGVDLCTIRCLFSSLGSRKFQHNFTYSISYYRHEFVETWQKAKKKKKRILLYIVLFCFQQLLCLKLALLFNVIHATWLCLLVKNWLLCMWHFWINWEFSTWSNGFQPILKTIWKLSLCYTITYSNGSAHVTVSPDSLCSDSPFSD